MSPGAAHSERPGGVLHQHIQRLLVHDDLKAALNRMSQKKGTSGSGEHPEDEKEEEVGWYLQLVEQVMHQLAEFDD